MPEISAFFPWLVQFIRVLFIVGAAYIGIRVLRRLIPRLKTYTVRMMLQKAAGSNFEMEKRATTLAGIASKAGTMLIWAVALMIALREVGFDVAPILAGAGVVGLAVGFGAQNLVRDVISGMFLLVENQIRVNDVAIINGTGGLVEEINLRTTVLRGLDGVVHIFPNGSVTTLSNMTREFSYYVFDIRVAYGGDTDQIAEVVKQIADEMMREEPYRNMILSPLEILGVDSLGESAVILKARIKTLPIQQWNVGREMNRRIHRRYKELDIEIPFPRTSFDIAGAGKELALDETSKQELKGFIHDVLREYGFTPRTQKDQAGA
ncbi:MAG: mechanosensitive ion channel family protein [Bryobacteraceae bacterium]